MDTHRVTGLCVHVHVVNVGMNTYTHTHTCTHRPESVTPVYQQMNLNNTPTHSCTHENTQKEKKKKSCIDPTHTTYANELSMRDSTCLLVL